MSKVKEVRSLIAHLGKALKNSALRWQLQQIVRVLFK